MLNIYTDGSCLGNPGKGGWAFRILLKNLLLEHSGYEENTTNNRMELSAVINAIKEINNIITDESKLETIKIITDSNYVIKCATGEWKRNKNQDLWKNYDEIYLEFKKNHKDINIIFEWVKGHNGDIHNEYVDKLARKKAEEEY